MSFASKPRRLERHARTLLQVAALLLLAVLSSCRSEAERLECSNVVSEGRLLARRGQIAEAHQKLERARTVCDAKQQAFIDDLQAEIERKEAEDRQRQERTLKESTRREQQPIVEFMSWVRERWEVADKREGQVDCPERGQPDHGWCVSRLQSKGHTFVLRFRQTDSTVFRFEAVFESMLSCDDLGSHRIVRTWQTKLDDRRAVSRSYCELTDKSFRGLSALVTSGPGNSEVFVFSRAFLDRDEEFKSLIAREGR